MKVRVSVKEVNYGNVLVEADDIDDAYNKAYDAYFNGEVFWNKGDFDVTSTEIEEE